MKRKRRNKQRKLLIIASISFLFIMTAGYAAFQTNLNITAKGNIKKGDTAAKKLIKTEVTTGDGLYLDTYESDENKKRYVYKGANPNNYIKFNNELWRIIAIEKDATLKITKKDSIGNMAWDTDGSDNWARPTTLNTYLNDDYYNSLSIEAQDLIQTHAWGIGAVPNNNANLTTQIASENSVTWSGNIGLILLSDYVRANTNTEQCGNISLISNNGNICKTTNYLIPSSGTMWTITPNQTQIDLRPRILCVDKSSYIYQPHAYDLNYSVFPTVYLPSDIYLDGEGTETNPYTIIS